MLREAVRRQGLSMTYQQAETGILLATIAIWATILVAAVWLHA